MDLDTAIDKVRELGENWKQNGAPHQVELGDAMLTLVARALEMPLPVPHHQIEDNFAKAAKASADHQAALKVSTPRSMHDDRRTSAPLETSTGLSARLDDLDASFNAPPTPAGLAAAQPKADTTPPKTKRRTPTR